MDSDYESIPIPQEGSGLDDWIKGALATLVSAQKILETKLDAFNAMDKDDLKVADVANAHRDLVKAVLGVHNERRKVADAELIDNGGDGLDLDAARAAIRGRLDGIRRHRDA